MLKTLAMYFVPCFFSISFSYGLPVNGMIVPSGWIVRPSTLLMV